MNYDVCEIEVHQMNKKVTGNIVSKEKQGQLFYTVINGHNILKTITSNYFHHAYIFYFFNEIFCAFYMKIKYTIIIFP